MCERLPEERREDQKEKQLMMIKAGYLSFCECVKYSLVSVEEK